MYPDNNRTKPTSTRPAVSMMNQNGRKSSETHIGKRQSPCDVQNTNSTPASSKNAIHSEEVKNGRLKFEIGTENRVKLGYVFSTYFLHFYFHFRRRNRGTNNKHWCQKLWRKY